VVGARLAPVGDDGWLRVARERTRAGAYEVALDAYRRRFALGEADPTLICNSAELLMALGRLDEAIEQYRESVTILESARDRDRREDSRAIALGYLGLAVALDRSGDPGAAREAIGRALAIDGATAVLDEAVQPDGDVFFVPPGDVFYYLGLVREAQGRGDEAAAAFRSYVDVSSAKAAGARAAGGARAGRYVHAARDHLSRLVVGSGDHRVARAAPFARDAIGGFALRVVHEATVEADGPLPAPLIDAAWRLNPRLLDRCLFDVDLALLPAAGDGREPGAPRREPLRLRLNVVLDADGSVSAVTAEPGVDLPPTFAVCVEDEVRARLHTSHPTRRKPTRARIDVMLAPVEATGL
jgi:hypothetical protein